MSVPSAVRGAYQRGRLRDAALSALPVLLLPALGIGLARGAIGAVVARVVLLVGFAMLRWRGRSWSQGAVVGAIARDRSADAVEFAFAPKPGVAGWVTDLARRESACCPFFRCRVSVHDDRVLWPISSQAGPPAQATLDEFFAGPERFGDGMAGLLDRLAGRGSAVTAPGPGRLALDDRPRDRRVLPALPLATRRASRPLESGEPCWA
jgi:hypothetical protein